LTIGELSQNRKGSNSLMSLKIILPSKIQEKNLILLNSR